ncbi:methenyltetrahydrofolate synthase domain-containing protein isoform X3 [Carassius gibelio]|uniref:methenyltetrahydrofolate synthase domain-containing protein isoform X3 n=1 Tax=Carassius gibelio TaxID=101364 RepID=UPI00227910B3|nr:methenyltetrahydrofolate synthase domain-containing protein isoform X3 [Carassius gibelio]
MESVIKINQGDTKWDIRHKVWNYIEVKNLASFPRPVHNRIPNFKGVKEMSVPVGLDDKVQVDLVVVGSVAVSNKGYRIGKGEGFADLEYAMMACMGAVCESTVVVTIVHDCQVVDIPEELIESHDLTVDFILTPTRIIKTDCTHPKPQGIIWSKLHTEILKKIPILKKLRTLEQEAGKDVALKTTPDEEDQTKKSKELKWKPNCHPNAEL